jgi:hypothetical protein
MIEIQIVDGVAGEGGRVAGCATATVLKKIFT